MPRGRRKVLKIVGELRVQKAGRVGAFGADQPEVGHRCDPTPAKTLRRRHCGVRSALRPEVIDEHLATAVRGCFLGQTGVGDGGNERSGHRRIIGSIADPIDCETLMQLPRLIRRVVLASLVVAAFGAGFVGRVFSDYLDTPLHRDAALRKLVISLGAGPAGIAAAFERAGLRVSAQRLAWIIRLRGDGARYRAALYDVAPGQSLRSVLDAIARGEGQAATVRLIEGITFRQVREIIDLHPHVLADTRGLDESALLLRIGIPHPSGEGLFLPDTYHFAPGTSALQLYREAWRAMERVLQVEWASRSPGLPLQSAYEALILASMIEKETGRAQDRPMVASVFVNRLRKGMLLQSDPTTVYALGASFDGRLRRRDLQLDHPHNTYMRPGLPPTPIALPGKGAVEAALRPAESSALFFVARGDGGTEFSVDLKAHNRAVERFILKR